MKTIYFIYSDTNIEVEMCVIPQFYDENIYFYEEEYEVFWISIDDIGHSNKFKKFDSRVKVRPASFVEICDKNLHRYITGLKICEGKGKTLKISYLQIQ